MHINIHNSAWLPFTEENEQVGVIFGIIKICDYSVIKN